MAGHGRRRVSTGRKRRWVHFAAWLVPVALTASGLAGPLAGSAAYAASDTAALRPGTLTVPSCRNGVVFKTPSPGTHGELYDSLFGIAAVNAKDVWAAGYYIKAPNNENVWQTLIEHYDGAKWQVVASPDPTPNDVLYAVTAISPTDVWVVGVADNKSREGDRTLTENWNGSKWSVVPSPGVGLLDAVAGSAPNNVWAAGFRIVDNGLKPIQNLIEHWNGTSWKTVTSPEPGAYANGTAGITVVAPDDVWAAGQAYPTEYHFVPTAEHWNGKDWTATILPGKGLNSSLADISSAGSDDVWAAGSYEKTNPEVGLVTFALIEHWNGSRWSIVPSPSPGGDSLLKGVAAVSANDAWAVGSSASVRGGFILRWDGKNWTEVHENSYPHATTLLFGVSAPSANDLWISGEVAGRGTGGYDTLAEYTCSSKG
jgi:hypothetical protein